MESRLRAVKVVHTVVWAFFVGSIVAVPVFARAGRFGWAFLFAGIVLVEVLVLDFNGLRCPLTAVAARG